jgi:hypothetical protein
MGGELVVTFSLTVFTQERRIANYVVNASFHLRCSRFSLTILVSGVSCGAKGGNGWTYEVASLDF